jgi:glycosyltransferase involved in cell wall biosynthesis
MCVSSPIQQALSKWFGVNASIVRPAIEETFFAERAKPPEAPITIACMPRKGRGTLHLVRGLLATRGRAIGSDTSWLEIEGLPREQVAARLSAAHIYISTSVREGLGLPPLEAMATGCLVVGFTGAGGLDYANAGNGVWVPDEDSWALALALESTLAEWRDPGAAAAREAKRRAGRKTAERYTRAQLERDLVAFWSTYLLNG